MPFYEYLSTGSDGCRHCRAAFTVLQRLDEAAVSCCPKCGGQVRRLVSAPNVVAGQSHRLKESNIEKAGFTQYRKVGKGQYEKTAGKGPARIRGDD